MKKVNISINGISRQFVVNLDSVLLDLLRDELHLTGAKQSCDRKGQCGACMVIVNGKAVNSCLIKTATLEGAEVMTVEGLGTPDNPHLIQQAFVLSGAIQCGFCTPGMIMATKALLDKNSDPDTREIKKALSRNLCRCTGYAKIIDAVKLASRFISGEITPEQMPGVIGVMTAKDIKGSNRLRMIFDDQPLLCDDKVRMLGDPIAIVAAQTKKQALAAADAVTVGYNSPPVIRTPKEGMAEGAVQIHSNFPNVCFGQPQITGDIDQAMIDSEAIVEAEFSTQLNHQAPLEPEACMAYLEGEGEDVQLVVIGRSIDIHSHMNIIQEALGWEFVMKKPTQGDSSASRRRLHLRG